MTYVPGKGGANPTRGLGEGWGWTGGVGVGWGDTEVAGEEAGPGLFTASLTHRITVPFIDPVNHSKETLERLGSR